MSLKDNTRLNQLNFDHEKEFGGFLIPRENPYEKTKIKSPDIKPDGELVERTMIGNSELNKAG